ncbi:MAG: phosphatidylinositol kinase, partial [Actinobacteria bacterium]|nr:phosphatidylinositol kinase [Actinomycetota bacterium]
MSADELQVVGQLVNASNATLVVEAGDQRFVYKPMSGERPLWDFPINTLHLRERAAFVLSELLQWNIVPATVIASGPYGVGSLQNWVDAEVTSVDVFTPGEVPADWLTIISGIDEDGDEVTLAHANLPRL